VPGLPPALQSHSAGTGIPGIRHRNCTSFGVIIGLTTRKESAGEDHFHGHCSLSYSEEVMLRDVIARSLDDLTMSDNVMRDLAGNGPCCDAGHGQPTALLTLMSVLA
jgi:hypothetical protein